MTNEGRCSYYAVVGMAMERVCPAHKNKKRDVDYTKEQFLSVLTEHNIYARKWEFQSRTLNHTTTGEETKLDTEIKEGTNKDDEGKDWQIVKRNSERQVIKTKTLPEM